MCADGDAVPAVLAAVSVQLQIGICKNILKTKLSEHRQKKMASLVFGVTQVKLHHFFHGRNCKAREKILENPEHAASLSGQFVIP